MNFTGALPEPLADEGHGEIAIGNARVVTDDDVFEGGVLIRDGIIIDVSSGRVVSNGALDWDGDYLLPGLVELHTDNLERHARPRPGVHWPTVGAVLAHDSELAGAGITTVLDALRLGDHNSTSDAASRTDELAGTIGLLAETRKLKADHLLHLRCELSSDGLIDALLLHAGDERVRLISLMDHTPGQRQFADIDKYREYYGGTMGLSGPELDAFMANALDAQARNSSRHRSEIVRLAREWRVPLASHDDATVEHVAEGASDGVVVAEFPTTVEAAQECRRRDIHVMGGAPNVMRGKSHSGNISARSLAESDCLDILSSDYIPHSLLHAPFVLANYVKNFDLPRAVATVTRNPAEAAGLTDRGRITVGYRADVVRVHVDGDVVRAREVYRAGERVS